jgi:PleD family two-component response regulator
MTVTLGLSECRKGTSLDDCIRAADMALYKGKREGKNRAAFLQHEEPARNT